MENPKVLIVTTPIRPVPTEYPPIGSLSVANALIKAGQVNIDFYDIDALRPTDEEAIEKIVAQAPDILGISAVVSTAYGYVNMLSLAIKKRLPNIIIIMGGNLGASAEILLRKTGVDFVVTGEGERTSVEFVKVFENEGPQGNFEQVKGLMFLRDGKLVNTGYQVPIGDSEIYDIDWQYLHAKSRIENFIIPIEAAADLGSTFVQDPRSREPHRKGRMVATLVASKGCVNRCTFCHRWEKGIRYVPVPLVIERIRFLAENYNVGFVRFGDENFGTHEKWLGEFCREIRKLDILWQVHGMRVNRIKIRQIQEMKDAGCTAVYFGMETGSKAILEIMEKNVKLEDNYNVMQWIVDVGLHSTIQLVLGMPGESPETIRETIEFTNFSATLSAERDPLDLSINYAQALPGTPLYEYARFKGYIGNTIDEEESYLLSISDRDASEEAITINYTEYPKLIVDTWRPLIIVSAAFAFIKKFGWQKYVERQMDANHYFTRSTGYFNYPKEQKTLQIDMKGLTESLKEKFKPVQVVNDELPGLMSLVAQRQWRVILVRFPIFFYRMRWAMPVFSLAFSLQRNGFLYTLTLAFEYLAFEIKAIFGLNRKFGYSYLSLRKIMDDQIGVLSGDSVEMIPLRKGR